jgi:hypothetical protein
MGNLSKEATTALVAEQQIDAITCIYTQGIDERRFGALFPALSHQST